MPDEIADHVRSYARLAFCSPGLVPGSLVLDEQDRFDPAHEN